MRLEELIKFIIVALFVAMLCCVEFSLAQTPGKPNSNKVANTQPTEQSNIFTDDFSVQSWGTGPSAYGNIWYQNDEYHMRAVRGGFIVMYAPAKPEYYTENASIQVMARSVEKNPPNTGYG